MKKLEVANPAVSVCEKNNHPFGLPATARKSTSSARPVVGSRVYPTGCCIQAFPSRIQSAEKSAPIATSKTAAKWSGSGIFPSPKIHTPRNVDSRKNASNDSSASGAPKISPTKREYADQFI